MAKGGSAWVGHHIGDLENWETLRSFREGVDHFERLFAVEPEVVAHDLHPDYLSTGYALEREGVEHVGVQHHHAHLAACLAEHGETGPAVGAIFDGTGYGPTARPGAESSWSATSWASSGPGCCSRCACRAATARPRAVAHGLRWLAGRRRRAAAAGHGGGGRRALGMRWPRWR